MRRRADGATLEVLHRIGLAPRQGVAVVRVGSRSALVSFGDGGVSLLLELDPQELSGHESAGNEHAAHVRAYPRSADHDLTGHERAGHDLTDHGLAGNDRPNGHTESDPGWGDCYDASGRAAAFADAVGGIGSRRALPGDFAPDGVPPAPGIGDDHGRGVWHRVRNAIRLTTVLVMTAGFGALADPAAAAVGAGRSALDVTAIEQAGIDRAVAAATQSAPAIDLRMGRDGEEGLRLTGPVGTVLFVGFLTLLPTLLLLMTSFTRILIVLHLLKQAIGTQTAPPAHLLAALALLLTGYVMAPTISVANETALVPWMDGEIEEAEMLRRSSLPFRDFMLGSVRESDLATFLDMRPDVTAETFEDIPLVVLTTAFVTSELRNAFQMGFAVFLPFLVIDVVVASVLMSMGMFMLPPVMVSLPFKLLLFVLVDGWSLVMGSLVQSFG